MNYSWKKIIAGFIAAVPGIAILLAGGGLAVVAVMPFDVIGLLLIWNSEDIGSSTFSRFGMSPTPGWMVSLAGWILLFAPIILLWHAFFH